MDISVSRLNNRLVLQLPAELPLGLVFVVGAVESLSQGVGDGEHDDGRPHRIQFKLVEKEHHLRCELAARAAAEVDLREGDRIRAGGHLAFDPRRADYFLLVRDVEIIPAPAEEDGLSRPLGGRAALTSILADIKRRSEAASLVEAELPHWVQKMAPPEVQAEMDLAEAKEGNEAEMAETAVSDREDTAVATPLAGGEAALSDELVAFLAEAMSDEEEVELLPEVMAELSPGSAPSPTSEITSQPYEVPFPATAGPPDLPEPRSYVSPPRPREDTDWLVILLIISFFVLTVAVIVASVLLWLR